jgi:V/A-type H+-transporting ATPase subunit E
MNAEQVVDKILAEANAEAESIVKKARASADKQMAQLDSELQEFDAETARLAQTAAADKLQRMLANARMANGRDLLAAKVDLLDAVFAKAKDAVNALPDDSYLALMTELMKRSVETGDEEVVVGKGEQRINEAFISKLNKDLGSGFKGNLRLADQHADITGGFILSRGKVQINAGIEVLIDSLRDILETELANELFE